MNQCILTGNLGADPELKYSQNGDPIATFNLAFRLSKDKTGWVKVVCFN
ncbi:MAG: single-stranded DNA-binding protein, partial [Syntrophobacteraceae bacterium]